MTESVARARLRERLIEAARRDARVIGIRDYGSGGQGRLDEWSDLDVEVFIREADFDIFLAAWRQWIGGLGDLLYGFVGRHGHPWAIYDAEPRPLRVDFDFHPESHIERIVDWPGTPATVDAMVLYDAGGGLRSAVEATLGKRDLPADEQAEFGKRLGDFWYFLLFCHDKLQRGEAWSARLIYHSEALKALILLLRLETGAVDRWEGSHDADGLEASLPADRLSYLNSCIPGPSVNGLRLALSSAAAIGRDVTRALGNGRGWPWPDRLAERMVELLTASAAH